MKQFLDLLFYPSVTMANEITEEISKKAGSASIDLVESVLAANIIVQLTFLILVTMSIVSWAIILQKWAILKRTKRANAKLNDVFIKAGSFEEIYTIANANPRSTLSRIFIDAYDEMKKSASPSKSRSLSSSYQLLELDNVERTLRKSTDNEISYLELGLGFLATAGSSCPFIGLFGTVFGIMNSFNKIAETGSASLNVVAPGIAEALLATGVGLFAAIPASIFFNSFLNEIKKQELLCNNFSTDFINIAKRNFLKKEKGR